MQVSKKALGDIGEDLAVEFLKNKGFDIIERNFSIRGGEIDIIAKDGNTLVFIEVKTRTFDYARKYGRASDSVGKFKMGFLTRTASAYLKKNYNYIVTDLRFDVLEIYIPGEKEVQSSNKVYVTHIKNAFSPTKVPYRRKK